MNLSIEQRVENVEINFGIALKCLSFVFFVKSYQLEIHNVILVPLSLSSCWCIIFWIFCCFPNSNYWEAKNHWSIFCPCQPAAGGRNSFQGNGGRKLRRIISVEVQKSRKEKFLKNWGWGKKRVASILTSGQNSPLYLKYPLS